MRNGIKNYAWGSRVALNHLFGLLNPDDQPQAEVWMGSHPQAARRLKLIQGYALYRTLFHRGRQRCWARAREKLRGSCLTC
ncbi:type I phosphomannose isomerase catalytic subunit [Enterobacter ludwigii]